MALMLKALGRILTGVGWGIGLVLGERLTVLALNYWRDNHHRIPPPYYKAWPHG